MNESITIIPEGSVTTPAGFLAAGITAGLKKSGKPDLAVIFSEVPASFAGAFTSCTFAAAPVQLDRQRCASEKTIRAIVVNSGNANACTGKPGLANAVRTCEIAAEELKLKPENILVSSTGRIGVQMPMDVIENGVRSGCQALSRDGGINAAEAIITTDTIRKNGGRAIKFGDKTVYIGAMTKGAGMIDPTLVPGPHATMLCYFTTDAAMSNALLNRMLQAAAAESFNRITVDGDMSTNDTLLIMANGCSGVTIEEDTQEAALFYDALIDLMQDLARRMVLDGEGATKFVTVKITNAPSDNDAKLCAEAIANSLLCKTAWFGCDPNWGRIVAALGYSQARFSPEKVNIFYDEMPVVRDGGDAGTPEVELAQVLKKPEFTITVDLGGGTSSYWVWTCDVSYEYVKINAEYHT